MLDKIEIEDMITKRVKALIAGWQQDLPDMQVVLGGSLISGLLIVDEQTQSIDADVRFLTEQPTSAIARQHVERVTGLAYRKTITVDDWPTGRSTAVMMEGFFQLPMLSFPLEVEGCIRNKKYVGWHQHFQSVLSPDELATIRAQKRTLRYDKAAYKAMKQTIIAEVKRRCVERGIVLVE